MQKSVFIFGIYSLIMGVILLIFPAVILPLIHLPADGGPWVNLLGFVLACSSYYYIRSASNGNIEFAKYTVHTRLAAPLVVIYLAVINKADWHFILFGCVDALGGLWTWYELKQQH